jgi:hypothetical protein
MNPKYQPPKPEEEPFRADPSDPAPFTHEGDLPAARDIDTAPVTALPGHPPTHSSPDSLYGYKGQTPRPESPPKPGQPVFTRPGANAPAKPIDPVERFGRTALWVGVASLFIFNVVFGPIAIIMGAMAVQRGQKKNGWWAIGLGAAGTAIGVAVLVLVSTGVMPSLDEMWRDIQKQN